MFALTFCPPRPQSECLPRPRLRAVTLGCKVNQYETEYLRQGLAELGYRDADEGELADLCLVNTCTVTAEGDAKSRQVIRQLARRNPGTQIVVMGCYATRAPEEVATLPGVVEVIRDKRELPDFLLRAGLREAPRGIGIFAGHTRAFVKVQDGCLLRCSFCIIPTVRPHLHSRPMDEIVEEVARLTSAGHREIVLTGIHLGHYGVDRNLGLPKRQWTRLAHLLARLAELPGEFRLRLSSIEATEVTRELLEVMAAHPRRVCPHLHIPLQSGSDAVLRRMRRRGGVQRFIDRCQLAQSLLDQPALTSDVIVGFPGETEDDFEATCRVIEAVGFSQLHRFPFSPRHGTPAAELPDRVAPATKSQRMAQLEDLERRLRRDFARRLTGHELEVLIEGRLPQAGAGRLGTACRYLTVELPPGPAGRGQFVRGHLLPADDSAELQLAPTDEPPCSLP